HRHAELGAGNVLGGEEVRRDQRHLARIPHPGDPELPEPSDGHGRGHVVAHGEVDVAHDDLTRLDAVDAGGASEDLFGDRLPRHRPPSWSATRTARLTADRYARAEASTTSLETPRPVKRCPFTSS